MENAFKYGPAILRYSMMVFCLFGGLGSLLELNTTALEEREFTYSPWVLMIWSFSNLAWVLFALKIPRVAVWATIAVPLILMVIDVVCGILVGSEQGAGVLLPVAILSLFCLAAGLTGTPKPKICGMR